MLLRKGASGGAVGSSKAQCGVMRTGQSRRESKD